MKKHWYTCIKISDNSPVKCGLDNVQLTHKHFDDSYGNYIIWCPGDNKIVYVGLGNIKECIQRHRGDKDPVQLKYGGKELLVTWIKVDESQSEGIEHYLGDLLQPVVGKEWSDNVPKIEVNLPDWAPFDRF